MDDLLDAVKDRLKSPYFGYVLASFVAINWRELFYLFSSDEKPQVRIDYFDAGTSLWELLFWPLVLGGLTSVLGAWLKWGFSALSAYPADQISIRNLKSENLILRERAQMEHNRNTLLAQQQQTVVDTAKQQDEIAKIEDPRAKAEAELSLEELRLKRTQGIDDDEVRRALQRMAEAHRSLAEIAKNNNEMKTAEEHVNKALSIETQLLDLANATNYLDISDDAQRLLKQIANNENKALVLTSQQTDELGIRAGLPINSVNSALKRLHNAGIVKINPSGKEAHLDKMHIDEFRRQYPGVSL